MGVTELVGYISEGVSFPLNNAAIIREIEFICSLTNAFIPI